MNKKKTCLLILGKGDTDYSDRNMKRLFDYASEAGFETARRDYHELEKAPVFSQETIFVMMFFPYTFWNENCEVSRDTRLYGASRQSYELFKEFFVRVGKILREKYHHHKLVFIISPDCAALDRDKIATIQRLKNFGISTSEVIAYQNLNDVLGYIAPERGVFIKCQYGSEGKGITLLREGLWRTNYRVVGDKLTNYDTYGKWQFTNITGRRDLLKQLLENDVIVEREILSPEFFHGKKFDVRVYVINGIAPHFFIRVNEIQRVVTNFSQGAEILHHPKTGLSSDFVSKVKEVAIASAGALDSRFLGVDIMFDGNLDGVKVIEVQTFTDFPDIRHFNLARFMLSDQSGLFL